MKVWVDADACPTAIRDIVIRACLKNKVAAVFVANKPVPLPASGLLTMVQVAHGADVADKYIAANCADGDLVVTQDIPLAADLVKAGATVISPRGDKYDASNIGEILASRNLLQELRDTGEITGGPRPFDDRHKHKFASAFDAAFYKLLNRKQA